MWKTVKLGDVCEINNGGTPNSKEESYWGEEIEWLTPKDMGKLNSKFVSKTERKITSEGLENSSAKLVPEKSVILSCRAPIGHVAINEVPMSFNQGCKGLVPNEKITNHFLYYFLVLSKNLLNNLGTGATFKEISAKTLAKVPISLPPLEEQKRIAAKLDAVFAQIDRAAALTAAKLAEAENLKAALLASLLCNNAAAWETAKLGDVCKIQPAKKQIKNKLNEDDKVSFLPMECLSINTMYPLTTQSKTLKEVYPSYTYFENRDVLLAKITPCFENGKLGIAQNLVNGVGFGSSEYIVLRCSKEILPEFLYYFLNQSSYRSKGKQKMTGAVGHKRVPKEFVENTIIPLPPLGEQKRIAHKLDAAFAQLEIIKSASCQSQENYQALKSAILKQELEAK